MVQFTEWISKSICPLDLHFLHMPQHQTDTCLSSHICTTQHRSMPQHRYMSQLTYMPQHQHRYMSQLTVSSQIHAPAYIVVLQPIMLQPHTIITYSCCSSEHQHSTDIRLNPQHQHRCMYIHVSAQSISNR